MTTYKSPRNHHPVPSKEPRPRTLSFSCPAMPIFVYKKQPALELIQVVGTEALGELYRYVLTFHTADKDQYLQTEAANINVKKMVGIEAAVTIELDGQGIFELKARGDRVYHNLGKGQRHITGLISSARFIRREERHCVYEMTLEPWLFLTQNSSDFRIFQHQSALDIVRDVLAKYPYLVDIRVGGMHGFQGNFAPLDYQVQYGETDFDFITRIMAQWGLYYYFEHSDNAHDSNAKAKHVMVLTDSTAAFQPTLQAPKDFDYEIEYYTAGHKTDAEYFETWQAFEGLQSGQWQGTDYDFRQPQATLKQRINLPRNTAHADLARFSYPSNHLNANAMAVSPEDQQLQTDIMRHILNVQLEQAGGLGTLARASGKLRGLAVGTVFKLIKHPTATANAAYNVIRTTFELQDIPQSSSSDRVFSYHTELEVQPISRRFRMPFPAQTPRTHGPQSAIVTGPKGNDLWTDTHGRIKVSFPWNRYCSKDENSSCWVRVVSPWSGGQLGQSHVPRIGQEVLVDFEHGDPNRPIVVGSINNPLNEPSWNLPSQAALGGIRSRELSKDVASGGRGNSAAGRSNHLVLDDSAGSIQAQLKSDHQHSSLSLGDITRIENHAGRTDSRGQGFELRSDGHGAIRSAQGLLISTETRENAASHITDMPETIARLMQGQGLQTTLANLAQHSKAQQTELDQHEVALAIKLQNAQIRGATDLAASAASIGLGHITGELQGGLDIANQHMAHALEVRLEEALDPIGRALRYNKYGMPEGGFRMGAQYFHADGAVHSYVNQAAMDRAEMATVKRQPLPPETEEMAYAAEIRAISQQAGGAFGAFLGAMEGQEISKLQAKALAKLGVPERGSTPDSTAIKGQKSPNNSNNEAGSSNNSSQESSAFPELSEPHLILSSPAGIQSTTPKSTHIASGQHTAISSSGHISLGAGRKIIASALDGFRFFTHKLGMKLVAAAGKIELEAQTDAMSLLASKDITITSLKDEIVISAKKRIRIVSGDEVLINGAGSFSEWTAGGIVHGTKGKWVQHSAAADMTGAKSLSVHYKDTKVMCDYDIEFVDINDNPLKNQTITLYTEEGRKESIALDNEGKGSLNNVEYDSFRTTQPTQKEKNNG